MKRALVLVVALLAACDEATTGVVTQLNLDRPVDVAFACFGGLRLTGGGPASVDQEIISSAQPISACDYRSGPDVNDQAPVPPGQEDMPGSLVGGARYYAFILQSGPGTVALASFDTKPSTAFSGGSSAGGGDVQMIDADNLTPGNNGITVGEDPVAIATDKLGCFEVIANAGSCDMSLLEINSIGVLQGDSSIDARVTRQSVKNGMGTVIEARPAAMVFEPADGTVGNACPATPTGLAYISYPSCHMVAGVDVSTGTIVTAIQFDAAGAVTVTDGMTVDCPKECSGGMVTAGTRPVALDLELDARSGRRLLTIGADNSNLLTIYDLDAAFRPFGTAQQVALEDTNGRLGIISVAISPLIGMGGSNGVLNDDTSTAGDHQFIYAVTNDGTVRVADIEGVPVECDTQVDPRYLRNLRDVDALSCQPVGAMTTPPRRAGARGPGIELTGDAMATSVEVFRVKESIEAQQMPQNTAPNPDYLVGYFGIITAANGLSYVLNIDDDNYDDYVDDASPIGTQIPLTIAHQLRDDIASRELIAERGEDINGDGKDDTTVHVCDEPGPDPDASGANAGGPRLVGNIARTVPSGALASEKFGGLPSIRQVFCKNEASDGQDRPVSELFFSAPLGVREEVFPDLRALRPDETWSLTWEGSLSLDGPNPPAIDGPPVRESQMFVDGAGMRMVDNSRPYCDAGVEPYDILQLRGCDPSLGDSGCPIGYTCYVHPQSQVPGLGACMLTDEAERLANACRPFLTSLRRYTIGQTRSGELMLLPRKHVLRTTPTTGCTDDAQCHTLANYAVSNPSSANPIDDHTPEDSRTWVCQVDPDRRPDLDPMGQPLKRCIETCDMDSQCSTGTVCTPHPGAAPAMGYCMEGVTPPQACVNAPQRYELRAGDAFALVGTRTGYVHSIIAAADGSCVKDPAANPLMTGRIPLKAPACDPTADPRTGRHMDGTFDPNPCSTTVDESEYQLNYVPNTCTLASPDETLVSRMAPALRLRTRALTLTLVDPTYQGDQRCHGDRGGMFQNVPLVMPGFQLAFRQTAGFTPLVISSIAPSFPVKVTRGPQQSIWIIDEGDYLSTSIAQASTRGKVYRVESRALGIVNLLE